ncbi:MAG: cytochrome P450 [Deltaproteobacteria bacterium]|nr:cytochrome P450 [Deltaproteobacteria bacterium]
MTTTAPQMPGSVPLLKNLYAMRSAPLAALTRGFRTCGDVMKVEFPGVSGHMLFHPEHVRSLLVDHAKHISKDTPGFEKLRLLLGNGLLTSDGDFWLRQRRIAQPAFHRTRIFALGASMVDQTDKTVMEWTLASKVGEPVDVADAMMRLTLRIVCDTMLGIDVDADAADVGRAVTFLLHDINERIVRPWVLPPYVPTARNQRFVASGTRVQQVIQRAVTQKRADMNAPGADFLRMLMEARDEETGEGMTDQQLQDELATVFAAGHETTANLLAWTFAWLSRTPHVRRKLVAELDAVLGDRAVTAEDYPKLPYTRMVLAEALRISPPVWLLSRRLKQPLTVGKYTLPVNSMAFVSPYVTHRHPGFWRDPEGFDPERFAEGADKDRPTFAYFPFGGGPRKCIGDTFALVEATLVLATLARKFELELPIGQSPDPEPVITLRPRGGLPMHVRERVAPKPAPLS